MTKVFIGGSRQVTRLERYLRAMAEAATVRLMLWDGQSRGTLMNALAGQSPVSEELGFRLGLQERA